MFGAAVHDFVCGIGCSAYRLDARGSDAAEGECGWIGSSETSGLLKDWRSGVTLKIRPLLVDGLVKEWTTGDAHDVTDRSFVVRRVLRINDSLPGEKPAAGDKHWVWQRGPWLLVDRVTGHIVALKLPDYDPGVSQVSWFRDYGAYCGVTASGKSLYAVVAQVSVRKPVLAKKLDALKGSDRTEPLLATFHPAGKDAVSFDIILGSAVLIEESGDEPEAAVAKSN